MSREFRFNRVLLKISGEALKGTQDHGYDAEAVREVVSRVKRIIDQDVEVALVVGAGNIWRGVMGRSGGMDRVNADYMGMLATVMNALCLRDFFTAAGVPAIVQSSIGMEPIAPRYDRVKAIRALEAGQLVIFAGGTGSPFFTTDTTAVLRALETDCDAVLKATKVDGVYTADPMKDPSARRFDRLFDVPRQRSADHRLQLLRSGEFRGGAGGRHRLRHDRELNGRCGDKEKRRS